MKTKRFPRLHDDELPLEKKRHLFIGVGGTRTHARPSSCIEGGSKGSNQLSYDSDTTFFQQILFKHYIDDTDDNKVDTIWLLGLQSIVEGVDRLDGHY